MQDDAVELVEREQPVPAHGLVLRRDRFERAVELAGEDDVDDVLRPRGPARARSSRRSRPALRRAACRRPDFLVSSDLAPSASVRLSPRCTPPPGSSQYVDASLLVPAEQDPRRASAASPRPGSRGSAASRRARPHSRRAEAGGAALALRQLLHLHHVDGRDRDRRAAARSASPARRRTARADRC